MATKGKTLSKPTNMKKVTESQIELKAYTNYLERIKHSLTGSAESDWINAEMELRD